ncbi:MAG: 16S rRNA (cytosine(1402)-N(4))-methyltransferase RsmH [Bacteroidales bacterium]|nr:16S rRNA (cytosine(1402)-N(4))-methyltransferase RsmH [Bacteroidales bacterium]MCF8339103.1 16S rRNA (cytosine(1402)-N(4))-methyltransferase RsmH [Bacteroidales bacterium]
MREAANKYHEPVMCKESIEALAIKPDGIYVDTTYGGGGHARAIIGQLSEAGTLLAFDQDPEALNNNIGDDRLILVNSNFRYIKNFLKLYKAQPVDGIFADLGVSSFQFDSPRRGFSTRFDGPLDLRMNQQAEWSAADILNRYSKENLRHLFKEYGEIKNASHLANVIDSRRKEQPISTTAQLAEAAKKCSPKNRENKYLAQVFQALRIEVNEELATLKQMLTSSLEMLKTGGRLVVISYHSLEDRLVKNFFRAGNFEGSIEKDFYGQPLTPMRVITRKPITPTQAEVINNPRARSAKLRIAEKK